LDNISQSKIINIIQSQLVTQKQTIVMSQSKIQGIGSDQKGQLENSKDASILDEYKNKVWMEGWLSKEGHRVKNWKKRYFVLRGGKFYYFTSEKKLDSERKGVFDILGCEVKYLGIKEADEDDEKSIDSDDEEKKDEKPKLGGSTPVFIQLAPGTPSTPTMLKMPDTPGTPMTPPGAPKMEQKLSMPPNKKGAFLYKFMIDGDGDHQLVCAAQDEEEAKLWVKVLTNAIEIENYFASCDLHGTRALVGVVRVLTDQSLKELIIKDETLTIDSVKALSDVIGKNRVLTKMTISNCQLTDSFMKVIASGLAQNESLLSVDLSANRISDQGVSDLVTSLYVNVTINYLNLSSNQIGDEGVFYLSDLLKANFGISQLDLRNNRIGPEGCKYLEKCLQESLLNEIELGDNELGDDGVGQLAHGLKANKHLLKLGLSGNKIGSEGLKVLCEDLISNRTLCDLDLKRNVFDQSGIQALVAMLKEQKSLERIDLGDNNNLGQTGVKALSEALKTRYMISKLIMTRKKK
jgi:hypothetical protein